MKKLITWVLLLTLLLGLFAGCKKTEAPTEPVGDYVTAQAAMEYLKALYKNTEEATPTPRDYDRYGVIRVGGEPFEIVWTVDQEAIKVVPGEDEMVKIDIDEQCQEDTPYVLTATITDKGGNSVSHSWNYIMPKAMDVGQILKDAYALADGESLPYQVTLTGKLTSIKTMYDSEYQNITVIMVVEGYEEYPIECYRLKGDGVDKLAVGNIITVTGTLKNYKGTIEFDSGCMLESWERGDAVDAPTDPLEIVKQAYALKDGQTLPYVATLTGKVIEIDTPYDPEYGNISVVMVVEGAEKNPITCYRLKGTGADQIAVDDVITVMGMIKNYKGTIEFDTGCKLMDRISGGREAEKPSSDPKKIFGDAKKLKPGQHLNYYATLTGKVIDIESPYDAEYKNISVIISVKGYENTPIICYRLKGNGVEKIARGDVITVKGIIENYKGDLEFGSGCTMLDRVSGGGVAKPETSNVKTIMTDAAKLKDGQHLDYYSSLTGKVIDIESPYDKEYGNITVVIEVKGYENMPIICYRLKGAGVEKIARGDTITVRGVLENYKGDLEYGSGCTLVKRVSGGGTAKPESSNVKTIMADALKLQDGQHLDYYATLTGKVVEIDSPYDKEYKNISVIIEVAGYESTPIICYRMKTGASDVAKIAVGDTITVRGVLENYKGELEFGSGCTLQKRKSGGGVAKPESSNAKDILADAAKLADGEKLGYYANLTGKVTKIDSPYDKEYGNISVYVDFDGTEMLCYRLKGTGAEKIAVGDTITVRGVIENYKGSLQFGTGSTMTKRVSGGGTAKPESHNAADIMADAKALAEGEKLGYYANMWGTVTKIDSPYDASYGNISVYVDFVGGEEMLCYRMKAANGLDASKIAVGDIITVRGVIENYKGSLQFGTGSTMTEYTSGGTVAKPESANAAEIMADAKKLAEGEKLSYYANMWGKVTKIDSPYDAAYGNISVYVDFVGGEEMLCYRLKAADGLDASKIAVGDIITVRGVIENYKGALQFGTGSTMTEYASGGVEAKPESHDAAEIMADAKKLADGEKLGYYANMWGKVTKIDSPYDAAYGNISVYVDFVGGEEMLCYRLKAADGLDASKIAVGDIITVRGVIENYKGALQFGTGSTMTEYISSGVEAKPESHNAAEIMADAKALADGEKLSYYANMWGKVTKIDSPYDAAYGNISVYVDFVGGEEMLCYRLKAADGLDASKLTVGDTITVRGVIENYKGALQFGTGSTMTEYISGGGVAKPESSNAKDILADATKLAEGEKLTYYSNLTGKVTEIYSPFDKEYGNISVYIIVEVEGQPDYKLLCYRMKGAEGQDASQVCVGDTITVRGVLTNYEGKVQFDSGSTMTARTGGGGVAKPESHNAAEIMADAALLEADQKLSYYANMWGKVTKIDSPYDRKYGNISIYVEFVGAQEMLCYRVKGVEGKTDVSQIAVGDTVTIRGVIENYNGALQFGTGSTMTEHISGGGQVQIWESDDFAKIMADANALENDQVLNYFANLTGKVTKIDSAYDPNYKNISVYIDLQNNTNILCYRMKSGDADASKIRVGDTIHVRGLMMKFKDKVQMGRNVTLEGLEPGYNPGDNMTPQQILDAAYQLPSASNKDEKQYLEGQYTLTGVITSVDEAYTNQYKNVTVTMQVAGCEDKPIQAYRMVKGAADVSDLAVGDTITVTGQITKYNNKVQFDLGCVLDAVVKGEGGNTGADIPDGSPVIHLNNVANRVSVSTQQQVWSENGITVTNDKASSSTDVNGSYTNPARFYRGSTVTVEYPAMTRIVFYMDTYQDDYADQLVNSITSVSGIVITKNGRYVTVDLEAAADSFTVPALVNQIRVLEITVCTGTTPPAGGGNVGGGGTGGEIIGNTPVDAPVAGTAYKWAIDQTNKGQTLYFAGTMDGFYGASTTNINEAVDVVLEEATNGCYLSFTIGGAKKYVNILEQLGSDNNMHINFVIADAAETVYTYNNEHKTLVTNVNGTDYYIGTYNSYVTFSACKFEMISGSFPTYFCTVGGTGGLGGNTGGGNEGGNSGSGSGGSTGGNIEIPAGSPKIDFRDVNNRESHSTAQQVWKQNGITVTNNKGTGNDVYNNTSSNDYARFYQNSELIIEYPQMTRLVFTHTSPYNNKDYLEGLLTSLQGRTDVVITRNDLTVQIDLTAPVDQFKIDSLKAQIRVYDITVCTGTTPPSGGNTGGGNEGGNTGNNPGFVDAPVAGTAYKFGVNLPPLGNANYYVDGGISDDQKYYTTTTDVANAIDVYLEEVAGGIRIYTMSGATKLYMVMEPRTTDASKVWLRYYAESEKTPSVFVVNSQYKYLTTTVSGKEYTIGTYTNSKDGVTYDTLSASEARFLSDTSVIGASQFPAWFMTATGSSGGNSGNEGGNEGGNSGSGDSGSTRSGYVIWHQSSGMAMKALDETYNYGYIKTTQVSGTATSVSGYADENVFELIDNGDGTYKIKDCYGKYLYMDGTYNSFNVSTTEPSAGADWKLVDAGNGAYFITNVEKNKVISYDSQYGSFGAYDDSSKHTALLVTAVEGTGSGSGSDSGSGDSGSGDSGSTRSGYVIWHQSSGMAMKALDESYNYGYIKTTQVSGTATSVSGYANENVFELIDNGNGTYKIKDCYGKYLYMDGTYNSFNVSATEPSAGADWKLVDAGNGAYFITNVEKNKVISYDSQYGSFGAYDDSSKHTALLVTAVEGTGSGSGSDSGSGGGSTGGNEGGNEGGNTPDTPSNPNLSEGVSIRFEDLANRTTINDEQQVWQQNGITVTNDRNGSTSKINGEYYNPVRFYKGTSATIEYTGMKRIVVKVGTYTGKDYAADLVSSLADISDITVTRDGLFVTIDFANAADSLHISKMAQQIRVEQITVYTEA